MAGSFLRSPVGFLFALLCVFCVVVRGDSPPANTTSASTYIFGEAGLNVTVSLTAAADTGDIFFVVTAPAGYDWFSFGVGGQMTGAIMFVVYATKNSTSMIFSPRRGAGNYEPAYDSTIPAFLANNSRISNYINFNTGGELVLSAICRKCATLVNPQLDLTSKTAPFMWAVGPENTGNGLRQYNNLDAPLRKHSMYTAFTMDMTVATVPSNPNDAFPSLGMTVVGASSNSNVVTESDFQSPIHGIALIFAFVLIVPFDAILRMCIRSARLHMLSMALSTILALVGFPLGFTTSAMFLRSRKYTDPHQVIGLFIMIFFLAQFVSGIMSFRSLKQVRSRDQLSNPPLAHKRLDKGHRYFGWFVVFLAVVNVGLGFNLALTPLYAEYWIPVVIAIFVVFVIAYGTRYMIMKNRKDATETTDYQQKYDSAIAQAQAQAQAANGWQGEQQPPPRYEQNIPLQNLPPQATYESVPIPGRY